MKTILVVGVLIVAGVIYFFYPKNVGGPMCSPLCPPYGLHFYKFQCIGFEKTTTMIDGYSTSCFGIRVGSKRCYGVSDSVKGSEVVKDVELPCNYVSSRNN